MNLLCIAITLKDSLQRIRKRYAKTVLKI
jgi:hypothetical protein